nr:AEC family transporter [uncultured Holophaga sp.]
MAILHLQIQLFLLILTGFILFRTGMITDVSRRHLTDLVIYVVLPANIIQSFHMDLGPGIFRATALLLVIGFLLQGVYVLLNLFLYRRFEPGQQISLKYGTICSNAGFMGLPLSAAIFGPRGLLYASVALLPIRCFMWSMGLSMYTRTTRQAAIRSVVTHPCIVAVVLGFLMMIFQVHLPQALQGTIKTLSDCCTALSMIVIGAILSEVDIRKVFDRGSLYYASIRLILIPAALYAVLRILRIESLAMGVLVILAAMPAGTSTAMLAQKYDKDPAFASKLVFTSTLISLFTLPVCALVLT